MAHLPLCVRIMVNKFEKFANYTFFPNSSMERGVRLKIVLSIIWLFSLPCVSAEVVVVSDSQAFIQQVNGPQGNGTISDVYSLLYQRIGIPPKLQFMPLKRQNRALDQSDYGLCTLYRFKNEARAKKYAFSNMVYFLAHYNLYQQSDMQPLADELLDERGHVKSLTTLMEAHPASTLLHIPSFSYGSELDTQLAMLPDSAKFGWAGTVPHNRLSNLFFAKRADFALIFPSEVAEYVSINPNTNYRRYRVAQVNYATKGYMMCNKHPDSYAYIERVNKALVELYKDPMYLKAHTDPYSESEFASIQEEFENIHRISALEQ